MNAFRSLSAAMHTTLASDAKTEKINKTLAIVQLSHSGRQSPRFVGGRLATFRQPVSPSSRRVGDDTREGIVAKAAYKLMFQTPRVIQRGEINDLIEGFADAAKLAADTGFDGVQLHAAHGYILSQFLSPKLNTREDEYSDNLLLIRRLITRIRAVTSSRFVLGIKINAGDYVTGGVSEEVALEHVREIALLGVDFIEISGGDYENPRFMATTSRRRAFFSSFSRQVVHALPAYKDKHKPLIVLTGSLRMPSQFSQIIKDKYAHLLGIGRLSVLCPDLPRRISPLFVFQKTHTLEFPLPEPTLVTPGWFPKLVGAGVGTAWYVVGMRQLAKGGEIDSSIGTIGALFWMWAWSGPEGFVGVLIWISILGFLMLWLGLLVI